ESYQKMSFRNRCSIAGANGPIDLSIPLQHGRNQKALVKDVRIAPSKWQARHLKSIESGYNRSPWFEFYKEELYHLYAVPCTFLVDWNLACFEWSIKKLGLQISFSLTESYQEVYDEDFVDFRNKILPKNVRAFPALPYRQVFERKLGFVPNLSVLDLLFCEGKNAAVLLGEAKW
ncbi:MAG: WbqC family protein, partial [Bacteroidetes bacterium]|nr:WbqC family protein [Bacteroidota bacterium]